MTMRPVTLLNIHYGIRTAAWEVASLFSLSYLYKQGLPLYAACLVYGGMFFMRLFFIPLANRLCLKKGVRFTLTIGTVLFALRYLTLIPIDGLNWKVLPFLLLSGIADPMYRLPYNTFFSLLSKDGNRGKDVGFRESMRTIIVIFAPVLGGWSLAHFRVMTFVMMAVITILSLLPLRPIRSKPLLNEPDDNEKKGKSSNVGFILFCCDAVSQHSIIVWQLTVFAMVAESYERFGLLLGLASLFQAVCYGTFGSFVDKGHQKIYVFISYALIFCCIFLRMFFATNVPVVIACDFCYACGFPLYYITQMKCFYGIMEMTESNVDYSRKAEKGRVFGTVFCMATAAVWAYVGWNFRWILILSVAVYFINIMVLLKYYGKKISYKTDI